MEYKITLRNHLSAFSGAIIFLILVIITICLIGINVGFDIDLFYFFSIFYFVNIGVVLFVHLQYFNANKYTKLLIDTIDNQIIYKSNEGTKTINFNEINEIEVHMMPSLYRGSNIQILPFEQYCYAVLYTTSEKIVISCLVIRNPMEAFKDLGIKITRIKRFFPNIN